MKPTSFLLLITLIASAASGQSSRISWSGIASGAGASSGSSLSLRSAAGQPLAGTTSGFFSNPAVGGSSGLFVAIASGWNLVSVPLIVNNYTKTVLFPTATSNAFAYQGSYIAQPVLANGPGYWLRFASAQNSLFSGTAISRDSIPVAAGWNLIGSISNPIATSSIATLPPGIIASSYFAYQRGYSYTQTIEPGRGYWVKTRQAGNLVLSSSPLTDLPPQETGVAPSHPLARLILRDSTGNEQTLYFSASEEVNPADYELPPLPPDGVFDIRFASGSMAAMMDQGIKISGAVYPVYICAEGGGTASLLIDGRETPLSSTHASVVRDPKASVALKLSNSATAPAEFTLSQNYPNPFNPTTTIKFDLPSNTQVTLKLYDALGREVMTLINGFKPAGSHSVTIDGSNLASGVYFYRIYAGPFAQVRKLLLLK